ncbi:MAG TPA: hypothetical protein VF137_00125 [Candidatus Dormibacteraeota bacterium]
MSNPYADAHTPYPTSTPGTLVAWAAIAIGGAALMALFGLIILIVGAVIGSNSAFDKQIQNSIGANGGSLGGAAVGTVIVVVGVVLIFWGAAMVAVNWVLYHFMRQRQQWAWITALVLLGVGTLLDLIAHSGSLIHLLVIQVPLAVLLLLTPTRQWVGAVDMNPVPTPYAPPPTQPAYAPPPPAAPPAEEPPASEPPTAV